MIAGMAFVVACLALIIAGLTHLVIGEIKETNRLLRLLLKRQPGAEGPRGVLKGPKGGFR